MTYRAWGGTVIGIALGATGCGDDTGGAGGAGGAGSGGGSTSATTASSTTDGAMSSASTGVACVAPATYSRADGCDFICSHAEDEGCTPDPECLDDCITASEGFPCIAERAAEYACLVVQEGAEYDCETGSVVVSTSCCQAESDATFNCALEG